MTDHVPLNDRVTCPFDHHSHDYADTYADLYRSLRAQAPVVWTQAHGGYWVATTYETVRTALLDSQTFSTSVSEDRRRGGIHIPRPDRARLRPVVIPSEIDGREHDDARLSLNKVFSLKRVAELEPLIARHVRGVVPSVIEMIEFDIIYDLASPVVAGVVDEYLDLRCSDAPNFFRAMSAMVGATPGNTGSDEVTKVFQDSWSYVVKVIEERLAAPVGDDVISHLARETSPSFTADQIESMVFNILLGGADTTAQLTAYAMIQIAETPGLRNELSADPSRLPVFLEEVLRYSDIVMGIARTVTRDVVLGGVQLRGGDRIYLPLTAANHDPAKYADPFTFDTNRGSAGHVAMGAGSHFCLGANLARAIARNILSEILLNAPPYHILEGIEKTGNKAAFNTFRHARASFAPS